MNDMTYELGDNHKRHEMATIEQQRAELYAVVLRNCLWWMEMSLDNPPGLLLRIQRALDASAEEVVALLKELDGGDA